MPQAFDAQNPPFNRLAHEEISELRAALDIDYFPPKQVIIERGKPAEHFYIIIKGAVEERDGQEIDSVLGPKDSFDARALVHGAAGVTIVAAEETLCYRAPKALILALIRRNTEFAAHFYLEISRKLSTYARREEGEGVEQVLRARIREARLHAATFIDGGASIESAGRMMQDADINALFVKDEERLGLVTGMNLAKAVVLKGLPLTTPVRQICHFDIVSVDKEDFVFEALIKMTRFNKRRLAVTSGGHFVGTIEDIDILGLVAGNSQLIPGRIDRARSVDELEPAAHDIQNQVERLERQGVKVEVIAEITSDLNRALLSKLFELVAPFAIRESGCLMVMGSEGRGEQTVRTDQDNGLLLTKPVDAAHLDAFRTDFTAALERFGFPPCPGNVMVRNPQWSQPIDSFLDQLRAWVRNSDETSAMNLGIFYDAVAVIGPAAAVTQAKREFCEMMRGETAFLARFALAIDLFEGASAGVLTTIMASVGVGSDAIDIKKSGIFPIVHGIRTLAIEHTLMETSTARRIEALVEQSHLGEELARDLKGALSYFMELRLRSQLRAMKTGRREEEAMVRVGEMTTRDRDLLRDGLRIVKRFRAIIRERYHLEVFS